MTNRVTSGPTLPAEARNCRWAASAGPVRKTRSLPWPLAAGTLSCPRLWRKRHSRPLRGSPGRGHRPGQRPSSALRNKGYGACRGCSGGALHRGAALPQAPHQTPSERPPIAQRPVGAALPSRLLSCNQWAAPADRCRLGARPSGRGLGVVEGRQTAVRGYPLLPWARRHRAPITARSSRAAASPTRVPAWSIGGPLMPATSAASKWTCIPPTNDR